VFEIGSRLSFRTMSFEGQRSRQFFLWPPAREQGWVVLENWTNREHLLASHIGRIVQPAALKRESGAAYFFPPAAMVVARMPCLQNFPVGDFLGSIQRASRKGHQHRLFPKMNIDQPSMICRWSNDSFDSVRVSTSMESHRALALFPFSTLLSANMAGALQNLSISFFLCYV
jgi:hypothetical protein